MTQETSSGLVGCRGEAPEASGMTEPILAHSLTHLVAQNFLELHAPQGGLALLLHLGGLSSLQSPACLLHPYLLRRKKLGVSQQKRMRVWSCEVWETVHDCSLHSGP